MESRTVIFLHIPKAAGSTLNRIIAQQAPPSAILKVGGESREQMQTMVGAARDVRIITGHRSFGLHTSVPGAATYITILRDPVKRFLSHFRFAASLPRHRMHEAIRSGALSIRDAARRLSDLQTRYIAGDMAPAGVAPDETTLEIARRNLEKHFAVVGITERFDESLVLLQRRLGWKIRPYTNSNVRGESGSGEKPSAEDMEVIRQCNRIDQALYDWARERFQREVAAEGASFEREVAKMKWRNRVHGWTGGMLGRVFGGTRK